MNNVKNICVYTFFGSSLETIIDNGKVNNISEETFLNTVWFENNKNKEILKLGRVLIKYNKNEKFLIIPNDIEKIVSHDIKSEIVEKIYIPENVYELDNDAFSKLNNLKSIIIEGNSIFNLSTSGFPTDTNIFVKKIYYNSFKNDFMNEEIKDNIKSKTIKILFYDVDNNFLGEKEKLYGEFLDDYFTPKEINSKTFSHWINLENNNEYKINSLIQDFENISLKEVYFDNE